MHKAHKKLNEHISDSPLWTLPLLNNIEPFLENLTNKNILILGAGDGKLGGYLSRCGAVVYAIDLIISPIWREFDEVFFTAGNNEQLPFAKNSFDMVVSCSTFQYVEHEKVFNEVFRVCKNDSILFLNENLPNNPIIKAYRLKRRISSLFKPEVQEYLSTINKYLTVGSLNHSGFYVEKCEYYYFLSAVTYVLSKYNNLFSRHIENLLLKIDKFLLRKFGILSKYCWFCTYRIHVIKQREYH